MTITPEESLLIERERILETLSAISDRAKQLVVDFRIVDRKILLAGGRVDPTEFSGFAEPINAILALLHKRDQTMTREDIAHALVAGGWLGGVGRAFFNARDSVDTHTIRGNKPDGTLGVNPGKKLIRIHNGLVGLYDWPDSKFKKTRRPSVTLPDGPRLLPPPRK